MAAATASSSSTLGRAADFVRPDFHQVNLDVENYLKTERNFKLDTGESECVTYITALPEESKQELIPK